jgi:hypothetical protein
VSPRKFAADPHEPRPFPASHYFTTRRVGGTILMDTDSELHLLYTRSRTVSGRVWRANVLAPAPLACVLPSRDSWRCFSKFADTALLCELSR